MPTYVTETNDPSSLAPASEEFAPMEQPLKETFAALWDQPIETVRAGLKAAPLAIGDYIPTDLDITERKIPVSDGSEIEIRIYRGKETPKEGAPLFYVTHGGGWVFGGHDVEAAMNMLVAGTAGTVVVSVDYRLAPEYKYPYAVNDSFDGLKWCIANASTLGIDPSKIVLGGGSAGGNLAAVLAQKTHAEGVKGIVGQALNIPVTCHPSHFPKDKHAYTSYEQNTDVPILSAKQMFWFWDQYLPDGGTDAYASPLLAKSLEGLPPALVQIAGMDPLRDEGIAYAKDLKSAGVPVTMKIYPGVPHGFYMMPPLKATSDYLHSVADFVKEVTSK